MKDIRIYKLKDKNSFRFNERIFFMKIEILKLNEINETSLKVIYKKDILSNFETKN